MTSSSNPTPKYDTIHIIGGLFGFCIALIFTISITYDIVKKAIKKFTDRKKDTSSENTSIDIRAMIYMDLFIILINMILASFNFVFSSNDKDCTLITKCCTVTFHISRCIMYLIFVRRIQVIYSDTVFAMSRFHAYILYGVIAIYSIPYISYINWTLLDITYHPEFGCLVDYKWSAYFFVVAVLDILIAGYCLYLFVYPLYRLIHQQEEKQISVRLYNVMIKYSVLYSSSICSSLILIILSYIFSSGYNYSIIDQLINGMILILLHPIHNRLYKIICCCLHSCCIIICDAPKDDNNVSIKTKQNGTHKKKEQPQSKKKPTKDTIPNENKINRNPQNTNKNEIICGAMEISLELQRPKLELTQINIPKNEEEEEISDNIQSVIAKSPSVSIRNMMKERAQHRYNNGDFINDLPQILPMPAEPVRINTFSPCVSSNVSFSDPIKENEKNQMIDMSGSYDLVPFENNISCSVQTNVNDEGIECIQEIQGNEGEIVDIILEEVELDLNDVTLQRIGSLNVSSFNKSSLSSLGMPLEFEKKRSNTLKFINYESTKL